MVNLVNLETASLAYGTRTLLKKMVELFPSPAEVKPPAPSHSGGAPE